MAFRLSPESPEPPVEAAAPTILWVQYGLQMLSPWQCRVIAKNRLKKKIASDSGELAPHLTLKKVHIEKNGYALKLFFLPVPEDMHTKLLETFQRWVGSDGSVRIFSEEETSSQLVTDANFKMKRQQEEKDLADMQGMKGMMQQCLALQGKTMEDNDKGKQCQRETGRLVAKVMSSVQSYKTDLQKKRKKPRSSMVAEVVVEPESNSDSDA